jgi:hypothetical protein
VLVAAQALRRDIAAMLPAPGVSSINHQKFGWSLTARGLRSAGARAHLIEIANARRLATDFARGGRVLADLQATTARAYSSNTIRAVSQPVLAAGFRPRTQAVKQVRWRLLPP